ncbi:MAG: hypothetical protein BGO37_17460 [Cellulomonas sp. 73-92]|uniref:hypothetical protein n=1 Tax=Cellulomonas sp. 73-92 TaxID=1895740 RepID=UPI0009263DE8|nr:hypothetical protein [Cellulomonas sp. 73-92]OJV81236.1 MAG: hypothetical protein BGO37_17460 [Cellulomonas sp. 73-92]
MSHRTQVILEDRQYARLLAESERTGVGLGELVRRAVDRTYGLPDDDAVVRALDLSFGTWAEVELDGEAYVESMRHGLGARLAPR